MITNHRKYYNTEVSFLVFSQFLLKKIPLYNRGRTATNGCFLLASTAYVLVVPRLISHGGLMSLRYTWGYLINLLCLTYFDIYKKKRIVKLLLLCIPVQRDIQGYWQVQMWAAQQRLAGRRLFKQIRAGKLSKFLLSSFENLLHILSTCSNKPFTRSVVHWDLSWGKREREYVLK